MDLAVTSPSDNKAYSNTMMLQFTMSWANNQSLLPVQWISLSFSYTIDVGARTFLGSVDKLNFTNAPYTVQTAQTTFNKSLDISSMISGLHKLTVYANGSYYLTDHFVNQFDFSFLTRYFLVNIPPIGRSATVEWQKEIATGRTESVSDLVPTSDGGYAFLDLGWGHQGYQVSTFYKISYLGNVQWKEMDSSFWACSFIQTSDGGFELFGNKISGNGDWTYGSQKETPAVMRLDSTGAVQSVKTTSTNIGGLSTSDGGYANWRTKQDVTSITKTNSLGKTQWTKSFNLPRANYTYFTSMIQTSDGGFALVGSTSFNGTRDTPNLYFLVAKTDSHGNLQWSREFGSGPATVDKNETQNAGALDGLNRRTLGDNEGYSVTQTSDGGFVVTGTVYPVRNYSWWGFSYEPVPNLSSTLFVKTDSEGNMEWNRTFTGIETAPVIQTSDGGYAFATAGHIIKTDSSGYVQVDDALTFPSMGGGEPEPLGLSDIFETSDGSLIGIGVGDPGIQSWQGDIYLVKTKAFLLTATPPPPPVSTDPPHSKADSKLTYTAGVTIAVLAAVLVSAVIYRSRKLSRRPFSSGFGLLKAFMSVLR